jgi:ABC-type dipeptide/oligopeptide/nickel transport system permease component
MAVVLIVGVAYALINLIVDFAHALVDPRIMDQI